MPTPNAIAFNSLTELIAQPTPPNTARPIPPLEKWHPAYCGEMDLLIKANGEWWHEGRKMTRQSMIDLFASVLWAQETGETTEYFLKTPVEKIGIRVEDVPLLITQVDSIEKAGQTYLEFTTSHGDKVIADDKHPIIFRPPKNSSPQTPPQPYVLVRQNGESKIYGLIHRNVFYHLIAMGELSENATENGGQETCLTLKSGECEFHLIVPND